MTKNYNSVTILKGIACVMVFMSHWHNTFYGWGFLSIDRIVKSFPFSLIYNGNLAVCIFMVLSGFLFSLKIYKSKEHDISWTELVLKRYFRLAIPIAILSAITLALSKAELFYNIQASKLLQNEWLSYYYNTELNWKLLLSTSLVKTLTIGDSQFYGPLWMMKYMFWGTFFCIILCKVLLELNRSGKMVLMGCLFIALFILNSYYICFLLGILLALGTVSCRSKPDLYYVSASAMFLFVGLICVKLGQILPPYLANRGCPAILSQYPFYNMLGALGIVCGCHLLVDIILGWENPKAATLILWAGKRSFSIFFTHWIVICSFSSWFYLKMHSYGMVWSVGVNFVLSFAIMLVAACIFYHLVEVNLVGWCWNRLRK